jgi:membrane protease YdiL (CAAX protease family)
MPFLSPNAQLSAHLLAVFLIVAGPLVSYFFERPFLRRISSSRQKLRFYAYTILSQWIIVAITLGITGFGPLFFPPAPTGGGLPAYAHVFFGVLLTAFFVLGLMPFFQSLRGEKYRAAYARAFHRSLDKASKMLPETQQERLWFAAVSLTAGVCEELLCRGFIFRYLDGIALHLPLIAVLLVASASFGLNHIYQGKVGMLKTGVAGLAFGGLFLFTGSLLLPMLLHTAIDLQALFVLSRVKALSESPPRPDSDSK